MQLGKFLTARWRAFAPIAALSSPRPGRLRGLSRWRWLWRQRARHVLIEPSVEVWLDGEVDRHVVLHPKCYLDRGAILWIGPNQGTAPQIELASGCYVGPYAYLGSCHRLSIGADTMIGAHSYLITANHGTSRKDIPYRDQGFEGADIRIEENVWIGCHVTVLPGVTIHQGAIVAAGAVVTHDIPAGETWGGIPARPLNSGSKEGTSFPRS